MYFWRNTTDLFSWHMHVSLAALRKNKNPVFGGPGRGGCSCCAGSGPGRPWAAGSRRPGRAPCARRPRPMGRRSHCAGTCARRRLEPREIFFFRKKVWRPFVSHEMCMHSGGSVHGERANFNFFQFSKFSKFSKFFEIFQIFKNFQKFSKKFKNFQNFRKFSKSLDAERCKSWGSG